jgi:hypothetical protein
MQEFEIILFQTQTQVYITYNNIPNKYMFEELLILLLKVIF